MKFIGIAILVLAASVLIAALPDLREMDRQDEFLVGCMESQSGKTARKEWMKIMTCERMWHGN